MAALYLNVNGKKVLTTDITYDDLVWLYQDYIKTNGEVPTTDKCLSKNNLPQGRIIKKVLAESGVTYKDFLLQFGKVKKVRTSNPDDYEMYVKKFISTCESLGRSLRANELYNNHFGLPNPLWFIKYCPDKSVTTYKQFLNYCGLKQNKHIWTKEEVAQILIAYEQRVSRPIISNDLCVEKSGISGVVVTRLFGGLTNAKKELGLMETLPNQPMSFDYYKSIITKVIEDYKSKTSYPYITWEIIESGEYGEEPVNHKSMLKSFSDNNEDFYAYVKTLGLQFNPTLFSNAFTFDDGEKTDSHYEYKLSTHLRSLGLKYKKDYFRSIRYNDFCDKKSKMTCDYLIKVNGKQIYIEVAGLISNFKGEDWRVHNYANKVNNEYRDKMILKEQIFKKNKLNYLFLFANEMKDDSFKDIIFETLKQQDKVVA